MHDFATSKDTLPLLEEQSSQRLVRHAASSRAERCHGLVLSGLKVAVQGVHN
jgi:hypothetical protein